MLDVTTTPLTARAVGDWLGQFGHTDSAYLNAHFARFMKTKEFAVGQTSQKLSILDVGAHWLHETYLYAIDGHLIRCVDSANTMREPSVIAAAKELGCTLHAAAHLEFGDGITEIETSSIDLVLFCEILEHLAFNPIDLWKEIYRVLRAPGRIILTTPNANYWPHLRSSIQRLQAGGGWGAPVADIMGTGTFGHHWKEYTAGEIKEYFARLSPDFHVSRCVFGQMNFPVIGDLKGAPSLPRDELSHDGIFMEISLEAKSSGIVIDPPWRAQYR
jgi:2-polyprenyl-6-hydroxyphenyl methylase/3-demethylubiquinone-9 3-methyltransferase